MNSLILSKDIKIKIIKNWNTWYKKNDNYKINYKYLRKGDYYLKEIIDGVNTIQLENTL